MKVLALATLALVLTPPNQAQSCAQITEIPALPGFDLSLPSDLTCNGEIVVGSAADFAYTHLEAFRWSEALGTASLGTLGGTESTATAVSCQGEVIVGHAETATGEQRPFRWTQAGGMEDLLALSGLTGPGDAQGVSADGSIIVGNYLNGHYRAFTWSSTTGLQALPDLAAGASYARDTSDDGSVVVGRSQSASGDTRAVVWSASTGVQDLGTLGGNSSEAFAVSGDGQVVVGWSRNALGIEEAFRWTQATGMVLLDPGLSPFSNGLAVNRDGSAISGGDSTGFGGAFAWSLDDGARAQVLPFSLAATGISPNGSLLTIVGSKPGPGGVRVPTGFLVRMTPMGSKFCAGAVVNSTGCSGYISAVGSAFLASDSMTLSAARLPADSFGFFLTSQSMTPPTPAQGSQGVLCLGGSIGRFVGPGQIRNSGAAGSFVLSIQWTMLPTPTGVVSGAVGETWSFQAWHRDANPTTTSNLTDALAIILR